MAKKTIVLPSSHLPVRMPLIPSMVFYMALDMYQAPGWLWGAAWSIMALVWCVWAAMAWQQEVKPLPGYGDKE